MPQLETCRQVLAAVEKYLGNGRAALPKSHAADIPVENYRFDKYPEYVKLRANLDLIEESGVGNPFFNVHEQLAADTTVIDGRELINFSSYNYLGMSGDPVVAQAAKDAIDRYGTSVSASRLVSGEKALHRRAGASDRRLRRRRGLDRLRRRSCHERNDDRPPVRPGRSDPARRAGPQQHHPGQHPVGRPAAAVSAQRLASARSAARPSCGATIAACWWRSKACTAWTATFPTCRASSKSRSATRRC